MLHVDTLGLCMATLRITRSAEMRQNTCCLRNHLVQAQRTACLTVLVLSTSSMEQEYVVCRVMCCV